MKRIGSISLAIFIFALSVFSVVPVNVYADDDKTVLSFTFSQLNHSVGAGMSASDATAVVTAHKDIYTSDGKLLFIYNPSNSYNWTTSTAAYYVTLNYSDEQLKNILMSKNPLMTLFSVSQALANNNGIRAFCAGLGTIFSGNSDMGTKVLDTLTGNYNYLDALNYDEDSQTITMSNDNGSVDKLREEIKDYYYKSLGISLIKPSGKPSDGVYEIRSSFEDQDEYNHDLTAANDFDYAFFTNNTRDSLGYTLSMFNKKDIGYLFLQVDSSGSWSPRYLLMSSNDGVTSVNTFNYMKVFYNKYNTSDFSAYYANYSYQDDTFIGYGAFPYNYPMQLNFHPQFIKGKEFAKNPTSTTIYDLSGHDDYFQMKFYSKDNSSLVVFKSLSALYNYIQGDQSAYLTKTINDTGKDISYSIKNMDENLGSKLDSLIDTINEDKKSMSASELQDAIDKGIEDLTKNTEDIKDNTSSILDILKEQNDILLQILGVTEYIAYNTTKDDGTDYTVSDLKNVFNTMYNGVGNAILYGKNTVTDSGSSAATQTARQSFKLSTAGAATSPDRAVVVYSADSSVATQDINNMDVHDGLFGKFPFSIPYQLYEWLQVLEADPVAPVFNYNYGFLIGKKNDPDCNLRIDLSIYEPWADQAKSFQRLGFTLLMALFIYNKFKGNSII